MEAKKTPNLGLEDERKPEKKEQGSSGAGGVTHRSQPSSQQGGESSAGICCRFIPQLEGGKKTRSNQTQPDVARVALRTSVKPSWGGRGQSVIRRNTVESVPPPPVAFLIAGGTSLSHQPPGHGRFGDALAGDAGKGKARTWGLAASAASCPNWRPSGSLGAGECPDHARMATGVPAPWLDAPIGVRSRLHHGRTGVSCPGVENFGSHPPSSTINPLEEPPLGLLHHVSRTCVARPPQATPDATPAPRPPRIGRSLPPIPSRSQLFFFFFPTPSNY